jgi:hypothetical protein
MFSLIIIGLLLLCFLNLFVIAEDYFAICTCAKYEPDIMEWVEYHLRMGASKIYVYDNSDSKYNVIESSLAWYRKNNYVVYERIEGKEAQRRAFQKCHANYKAKHKFIAFIDVDEFIVVKDKKKTIPVILKDYEKYGALGLNWMEYGRSGHVSKPPGGVIKNYHKCHPMSHVKLIANMNYFTSGKFLSPHQIKLDEGYFAVNEKFEKITSYRTENGSFDKIYLNHYVTKSLEDFANKNQRGSGWKPNGVGKTWKYLEAVDQACNLDCPILEMPNN